ncbi:MAG: SPOR domain-containing protein [Cellvibrionaceae bacterium]|nr:SPOR domain-containing protein [Cellvibrionaceae bacterium]
MDDGVKQRIVGSFVLLALLVIFLPVFFDRERIAPVDRETQIPLLPELEASEAEIQEIEMDLTKDTNDSASSAGALQKKTLQKSPPAKSPATPPPKPRPLKTATKAAEPKKVVAVAAKPLPTMPPDKSVPVKKMFTPKDTPAPAEPYVKPSLDKNGVPQSWVLQVGSFRFEDHAKQMRDNLVKMGYRAFVRGVDTANGRMTRVFVGPKLDKSRLLEAQKVVEERYQLKGILVRFEP